MKNHNSILVNYRQYKIAKLVENYEYVIDLGFAKKPNKHLKNKHLVGVDIKKDIKKPDNYDKTICTDVMNLSNTINHNSVDAIIAGELLEHLLDPISFLKECNKVLKKNGKIVLSTPNPHSFTEIFLTMFMIKSFFTQRNMFVFIHKDG